MKAQWLLQFQFLPVAQVWVQLIVLFVHEDGRLLYSQMLIVDSIGPMLYWPIRGLLVEVVLEVIDIRNQMWVQRLFGFVHQVN